MEKINVRLPRILFNNNIIYKLDLNELRTYIYIATQLQLNLDISNTDIIKIFSRNTDRIFKFSPKMEYLTSVYKLFLLEKEAHNNNLKIIMDKKSVKTVKYPYFSVINNELVSFKYMLSDFKIKYNDELSNKNKQTNMTDYYTMPSSIVDLIMNNRLSPYTYKSILHLIELDSITYNNGRNQTMLLSEFLNKIHVDIKHIGRLTNALDDIIKNKYIHSFESYTISGKGSSKKITFNLEKLTKKTLISNE